MLKISLLVLCLAACAFTREFNLFNRFTSTTTTTTAKPRLPLFINNNVPKADIGCTVNFECKKKLKVDPPQPKPCVKYCVKNIVCPNNIKIQGQPNQCAQLNEDLVRQELIESQQSDKVGIMQVAMIDFPCQPGYLPDSRGRCREVW
ncbi:uncharacterized protein LOC119675119 [Teleopsis dalmanni]|uniref:uncharacterized protein LOC119675119 n=1 Tax=Teleopsis dalmanni TaxID=139649 RepID=UPI0018CEDB9E|nr:uncharacterized protein LOC119675119 [Teleopsis dalmanni]